MNSWCTLAAILAALAVPSAARGDGERASEVTHSSPPGSVAAAPDIAGDPIGDRGANPSASRRTGRVHVSGHCLVDDQGPFLGLGVSYFTALWRCRHDRERLERDLEFLSSQGFNYYRMLSMVGWYPAWDGREIAPVSFTRRDGKRVEAWDDYWQQLAELIDIAYDRYGLRTQVTIFADAQLMPDKEARLGHMQRLLTDIVPGREHKILMLEVANEAWQNGFPGDQGVADLKEFTRYLDSRTEIPVAITSNHHESMVALYKGSAADLATWHFSRDRSSGDGWGPVYDCWDCGEAPGCPPAVSNEPIGPGSSVDAETQPIRLVSAAAFAYVARLPAYVFHCEAGVFGKSAFEGTPAIDRMHQVLRLLPSDLPNWDRHDGKSAQSRFTLFASGQANRYCNEVPSSSDGCIRMAGAHQGEKFVYVAIGIRPGGLQLQARQPVQLRVCDPLTGETLLDEDKEAGERFTLPTGSGAWILLGSEPKS